MMTMTMTMTMITMTTMTTMTTPYLASVDSPPSTEFARGFHVPPIQVVAHTSLHSTNLKEA